MKFSDLRPCDKCGKKIAPIFYTISMQQEMVDHKVVGQFMGMNMIFGDVPAVALAMIPDDEATYTLQVANVIVCQECFLSNSFNAWLLEKGDVE